jgi:hypothetical protein
VTDPAGKLLNINVVGSGHHSKEIHIPGFRDYGLGDFSPRNVHDGSNLALSVALSAPMNAAPGLRFSPANAMHDSVLCGPC